MITIPPLEQQVITGSVMKHFVAAVSKMMICMLLVERVIDSTVQSTKHSTMDVLWEAVIPPHTTHHLLISFFLPTSAGPQLWRQSEEAVTGPGSTDDSCQCFASLQLLFCVLDQMMIVKYKHGNWHSLSDHSDQLTDSWPVSGDGSMLISSKQCSPTLPQLPPPHSLPSLHSLLTQ